MSIQEHNQQVLKEWKASRISHYKSKGCQCLDCGSYDLKASKATQTKSNTVIAVCQECHSKNLEIPLDHRYTEDCVYRGKIKLT